MPYRGDEPWDAVDDALGDWEHGFYAEWQVPPPDPNATWTEAEQAKQHQEAAELLQRLCDRAPALYETMLSQKLPDQLQSALREIAEVPLEIGGFDARRLQLVPDLDLLFHHLDLALIRDAIAHLRGQPTGERKRVFQLLLITALDSHISPIAAWYFQRAARLLLFGLHAECVAMCRAVLEAALRFALDGDVVRELKISGGSQKDREPNLWTLIEAAALLGLFSAKDKGRAHAIRKNGNKALHPGNAEGFDAVRRELEPRRHIADLAILLRALFPQSGAGTI